MSSNNDYNNKYPNISNSPYPSNLNFEQANLSNSENKPFAHDNSVKNKYDNNMNSIDNNIKNIKQNIEVKSLFQPFKHKQSQYYTNDYNEIVK